MVATAHPLVTTTTARAAAAAATTTTTTLLLYSTLYLHMYVTFIFFSLIKINISYNL
jgi:hypothetical protein